MGDEIRSAFFQDLAAEAQTLSNDDDSYTFWDNDMSVAWDVEESFFGKLGAIYVRAGWERCRHRDGAVWHFDVKVGGSDAYRSLHDAVQRSGLDDESGTLLQYVYQLDEQDREDWWEETEQMFKRRGFSLAPKGTIWSCGRSGGYVNAPDLEPDHDAMIRLAEHCDASRRWFNSADYGSELAERAIELLMDDVDDAAETRGRSRMEGMCL